MDYTSYIYVSGFLYLILFLLLLCTCGVIIYGIKKYKREKRKGCVFVTTIVALFLSALSHQMVILNLNYSGFICLMQKNDKTAIKLQKASAKLAIIPSQKSSNYGSLGISYLIMRDSKNAMRSFDKAYDINKSYVLKFPFEGNNWAEYAGRFYCYAGQYDKAYQIAGETKLYPLGTIAAIYQKDYKKALGYANLSIGISPKIPDLYAQRAYIYQKLNNIKSAKEDLSTAISLCKNNKKCIEKQYKFQKDSYWAEGLNKYQKYYGLAQ